MRITNQMMTDAFMQNLRTNLRGMSETQRRLSSGKEISRPSDDPVRLQQVLKLDTALDQHHQYLRNIDDANSWLSSTDAALNQAGAVLHRARELAVSGASGTHNPESMQAMALEISQLLEQLGGVANASHAGRYLFAGPDTGTKPYEVTANSGSATPSTIAYNGVGEPISYEIGVGVTLKINATGQDAFGGTETFQVLDQLRIAMEQDDKTQINDALGKLEQSLDTLLTARADVGARMNRLEATKSRLEDDVVNMTALKSQAEDADIAEVIMQLTTQESVYRASLAAGARIIQPSLVDYLR